MISCFTLVAAPISPSRAKTESPSCKKYNLNSVGKDEEPKFYGLILLISILMMMKMMLWRCLFDWNDANCHFNSWWWYMRLMRWGHLCDDDDDHNDNDNDDDDDNDDDYDDDDDDDNSTCMIAIVWWAASPSTCSDCPFSAACHQQCDVMWWLYVVTIITW